ncbi:ISAzo13 family transposase [Rhodopirellula baltica]|uniref:Similar to transposase n=3 Tax=Rhodopirellula baltica TaxID=265606 RepID=Q7UJR7_RHOBA|nr:ISAzo13 family transposase [Rhodopirellula baltica]CAD77165.1 similar to transposase [Rhodopirellula baltica SH 1]
MNELRAVIQDNTAGSPTVPGLKWTHLSVAEIVRELFQRGIKVANEVVSRLLGEMGFKTRQQVKSKTKAPSRDRDEQFEKIEKSIEDYKNTGDPVFSIDSKRKESLGEVHRSGDVIANQAAEVLDHDLPAYRDGEVTPHGIYDVQENTGHVTVTTGSDTGEFAVASFQRYWEEVGSVQHASAKRILLLCDCGGSNSYRSNTLKYHLQELSNELGLPIQVAHYPVHCSKYNPIERREFSHVERAFSGRIFSTASDVAEAAESTSTQTGLNITTAELPEFQPVRKSGKRVPKPPNVEYDKDLPDYNYTFNPQ